MKQYLDLLSDILENGVKKSDRTGTGTISVFGREIRHNMEDGFPLLTTKKMGLKNIFTELKWFLRGDTNIKWLINQKNYIWVGDAFKYYQNNCKKEKLANREQFIELVRANSDFAEEWGSLGPIYGKQWRNYSGVDQIKDLIETLRTNPDSRRMRVSAWNVSEIDKMKLPPCHFGFQIFTRELTKEERQEHGTGRRAPKRAISLCWQQRSVDTALGLPYNVASYALLLSLIAKHVNMVPEELIGQLGDTHIYSDQLEGVKEQIIRVPKTLPILEVSDKKVNDLKDYNYNDIKLLNYQHHDPIAYPLNN